MPTTEASASVEVAVGLIVRDGHCLISRRADGQHQGGLWEFPGGKQADDESAEQALQRELHEELGIVVRSPAFLFHIEHDYGDKRVRLAVWLVEQFSGEPSGREGQPVRWVALRDLADYPFPAANQAILERAMAL